MFDLATSAVTIPYDVHALQTRLNEIGYGPLEVDGIQGPRTNAAIVAFKRANGLRPRPYIGPITIEALWGGSLAREASLPWLAEALRIRGLHEARDTSKLRQWFAKSVQWIDPREIPWCGAFVATCLARALPDAVQPENPLGARNWAKFGREVTPQLGAVMVFWRGSKNGWQGHVAFYYGEDDTAYHVIGGNQSDAVTVTRVAKSRLISARWPDSVDAPETIIHLTSSGQPLSHNEA